MDEDNIVELAVKKAGVDETELSEEKYEELLSNARDEIDYLVCAEQDNLADCIIGLIKGGDE